MFKLSGIQTLHAHSCICATIQVMYTAISDKCAVVVADKILVLLLDNIACAEKVIDFE